MLEQLHGCNADTCSPGSAVPWDQASDALHLACVTKQGADNYMLQIADDVPADSPVRQLILAAVVCIDMVLKE